MTEAERTKIAGRFTIAEITADYIAVGCIGSLWADDLTEAQIDHIKGFYNHSGCIHEVWGSYPVKLNHTLYNDFLILYHGKQMVVAKCYGIWGCPYYRTESGHTFSINETPSGKVVFYYGNVKAGEDKQQLLTEAEKKELFKRVKFEN